MCWVLSIPGLETCILQPRDPAGLDLLILTLRSLSQLPELVLASSEGRQGVPVDPPKPAAFHLRMSAPQARAMEYVILAE